MSAALSLRLLVAPTRPATRGDCAEGQRPCPWASCRYHLRAEDAQASDAQLARRRHMGEQGEDTCALDVADRGELAPAAVAVVLGLSRQRVQQIEASGVRRLEIALADLRPEGAEVFRGVALGVDHEGLDLEAMRTARAATADDEFADRMWRAYERRSRRGKP